MTKTVLAILARRLLVALPLMLLVSLMVFVILRLLPVDPLAMMLPPNATIAEVDEMRVRMGFDRPMTEQYLLWLKALLGGDLGRSIQHREDVFDLIGRTLPATLELALIAVAIASVVGLAGGMIMFYVRNTRKEPVADVLNTVMMSVPEFLWAILLILLFGVAWNILPFTGRLDPEYARPVVTGFLLLDTILIGRFDMLVNALEHMVLPSLALALGFAPLIMRVLRSSLLDVILDDYVNQARLRGVSEARIVVRHALKNAIIPTITLMGVQFGFLFGGTLLVEVIYSYPGLGNLMVEAVRNADLPIIQGVALTYCLAVLAINALVDVTYMALNPKLRRA